MRGLDPIEVRLRLFRPLWSFPSHHLWTFFDHLQAVVPPDRNIHGSLLLTRGYSLAFVPQDAVVESATGQTKADASHTISATYSFPKALIAIAQIIFSAVTLVRASGAEIKHFGYAAFGLTVSPYIVMSLLNLCGNALNPTYPTLYVVGSDIMEEARARGSKIDGEVGTLVPDDIEMPGFTEYKVSGRSSNLEDLTPPSSPVSSRSQSRASGGRLGSESETQTGFQLAYGGTERYPDLFPPPIRRWNFTVTGPISASEALPSMARVLRPGLHVPKQAYHSAYRSETHSGPLDTEPKGKDLKVVIEWHTLHPTTPTLFIPTCSEFQRSNGHEWQMDLRHYIDASWTSDVEGHYERGGSSIARDGGFFPNQRASCKPVRLENVVRLLISSLPFAIIGGLSSFRAGAADGFTRFVVLSWLAIGTYFGANLGTVSVNMKRTFAATRATRMLWRCYSLFYIALWTAWTAMLFRAVVLQMLDWGTCTRLY